MDGIEQFKAAIRAAGLTPPERLIPDSKLHRFPTNGRAGDDAGWYVFHGDGIPAGCFGDWRTGVKESWRADIGRELTPAELAAHQAKVDAMRREREREEARRHAEAASRATAIWQAAQPATGDNPYLALKQISPVGSLREIHASAAAKLLGYTPKFCGKPLAGRLLVAPIKVGGGLSNLELIDEAGHKSVLYGGQKKGGYWAAQKLPDGDGAGLTRLIGEGVATTLSAQEATGYLAVAALSSGNLLAVASQMRERYPAAVLGILGDLGNGQKDAEEAARVTGSAPVLPDFGPNRDPAWNDLNDMTMHRGREAVAECIRRQLEMWREQGGGAGPFDELPPAASYEEVVAECIGNTKAAARVHHDGLTTLRELFDEPEESEQWLVEGLLPAAGFSAVAAKPKVGKSTWARQLALSVARGEPFLGRETTQGPVLYVALEEKRGQVRAHFRAMGAAGDESIHVYTELAGIPNIINGLALAYPCINNIN